MDFIPIVQEEIHVKQENHVMEDRNVKEEELTKEEKNVVEEEHVGEVKVENEHVEAKGVTPAAPKRELRYSSPSESGQVSNSPQAANGGVSRNSPCPCGSGKKYKRCHGAA